MSAALPPPDGDPRLESVELWLPRAPWPLLPRIRQALAAEGEPLRWAITAVEPNPAGSAGLRLRIEAMVIRSPR